jgi:hypothetical protein
MSIARFAPASQPYRVSDKDNILHNDAVSIFAMDAPVVFTYKSNITGFTPDAPYSDIVFWYPMKRMK